MASLIISVSSKYGVDVRTAALVGILGCLGLWIYVTKRRPRPRPKSPEQARSSFLGVGDIHGGDLAWHRLEEFNEAQANPATLANAENLLKALLEEEHLDLVKLQQTVGKLEMGGREDSAVKMLKNAAKKAHDLKKPHEAYEIEMLLAEMLIYKGEWEKALKCNSLNDESIKDNRRPLYKAIIYKILRDTDKAKECWEEFVRVQDPPLNGASQTDFDQFERKVNQLEIAIRENARRK